ncbi:MAG: hypothetical protein FWF69_01535 [Firmicutes bacterium]|nr:hypothetical protein [Bacillota bacterium]
MRKQRMGEVLRAALRIVGYQAAFGFFGLMLTPSLLSLGSAIRIPLASLLIVAAGLLMFMDGANRGQRDCAASHTLDKLARKGAYTPSAAESAKRFSRLKGVLGPCAGVLPILPLAVYVAVTARPFVYTLQDLPPWLSAYASRPEISAPLQYLEHARTVATLTDYLRVAVRFVLFLYVGLFDVLSDAASIRFDRVSPLLALIMPAVHVVGYQLGPVFHARGVKLIEDAKRRPRKRLKKNARKGPGPGEKKRLI